MGKEPVLKGGEPSEERPRRGGRKLSEDQWRMARAMWEGNPKMTLSDVARRMGVSPVAVYKHAVQEGWTKITMGKIEHLAHQLADGVQEVEAMAQYRSQVLKTWRAIIATISNRFPVGMLLEEIDQAVSAIGDVSKRALARLELLERLLRIYKMMSEVDQRAWGLTSEVVSHDIVVRIVESDGVRGKEGG